MLKDSTFMAVIAAALEQFGFLPASFTLEENMLFG